MHPNVHCSTIYNSQPKCPSVDDQIIWSIINTNEILSFATIWIDLKGITLSEISQTEKDKYHMESKEQNKQKTETDSDTEDKLMAVRCEAGFRTR